jgi:hypothetical protein
MPVAEGAGIFVSYRRQDSSHLAGRLYDRLAGRFGERQIFMDVDTIEPGVDFTDEIRRAVAGCRVLLVIIGPSWLTAADERGGRRLDDPDDLVRLEIEAALARDVRVIPILVEGVAMPRRDDLPEGLAGLARRNAFLIRHESFRSDTGRLVAAIERILAPPARAAADDPRLAGDVSSGFPGLAALLASGAWQEADVLTDELMRQAVSHEPGDYLSDDDFRTFPCGVLSGIDDLWRRYSDGRFGFSAQLAIWDSLGAVGTEPIADSDTERQFGDRVGWRVAGRWLSYDEYLFDVSAAAGHLPRYLYRHAGGWWLGRSCLICTRLRACRAQQSNA